MPYLGGALVGLEYRLRDGCLDKRRRIKCLTIVDDFSRECLDFAVHFGISGEYISQQAQIGQFRGLPGAIRTEQGPEVTRS